MHSFMHMMTDRKLSLSHSGLGPISVWHFSSIVKPWNHHPTMLGKSIGKLDQIARPASFRTNASQSATQENHQENKQPSEILLFEFQAVF